MTRLSLLFFIFVLFSSCGDGVPKDIIAKENIASVLTDLHLADGYASSLYGDTAELVAARTYQALYKKHGIDSLKLRKSLVYYSERPEQLEVIYTTVEAKLMALETAEKKRADDAAKEALRKSMAEEAIANAKAKATRDSLRMLAGTYDFGLESYRSPAEDYLNIRKNFPVSNDSVKIKADVAVKDSLKIKGDTLRPAADTLKSKSLKKSLLLKRKKLKK